MDRNEKIIRLLSQAAEGKKVEYKGIGKFFPNGGL